MIFFLCIKEFKLDKVLLQIEFIYLWSFKLTILTDSFVLSYNSVNILMDFINNFLILEFYH